ncbi:MAG: PIN domain-containing protein [Leptospirales bacterium]
MEILKEAVSGRLTLCQPVHFVAEVAAVLARVDPTEALNDLHDLLHLHYLVRETPEIYAIATELATRRNHHLFDTLYHAVALATPGATFITADQRYYAKAQDEGQILLLSEWSPRHS